MHAHTHTVSMKMERVEMLADWTNTDNKLRKAQLEEGALRDREWILGSSRGCMELSIPWFCPMILIRLLASRTVREYIFCCFKLPSLQVCYDSTGKQVYIHTNHPFKVYNSIVSCIFTALCNHTTTTKLLQSCPTLCNPIDDSSPGSAVPGILQASTLPQSILEHFIVPTKKSCSH